MINLIYIFICCYLLSLSISIPNVTIIVSCNYCFKYILILFILSIVINTGELTVTYCSDFIKYSMIAEYLQCANELMVRYCSVFLTYSMVAGFLQSAIAE